MESDLFGYAIMAAFYGGLLFWLFVAVRRRIHPSRSLFLAYGVSVGIMLAFLAGAVLVMMSIAAALGITHNPGQAFVGVGVGGILGALAVGWQLCKSWLTKAVKPDPALHQIQTARTSSIVLSLIAAVPVLIGAFYWVQAERATNAGELYGTLSWAQRKCSGEFPEETKNGLLRYRGDYQERFDKGAIAGRRNVERLYQVYGIISFCEIVIDPLMHGNAVASWLSPSLTTPLWAKPDSETSFKFSLPEPETRSLSADDWFVRDAGNEGTVSAPNGQ